MGHLEKTVFSYVLLFATILEGLGDVLKGLGVVLGGFGAVLGDGSVKILMSWSVSGRSWGLPGLCTKSYAALIRCVFCLSLHSSRPKVENPR